MRRFVTNAFKILMIVMFFILPCVNETVRADDPSTDEPEVKVLKADEYTVFHPGDLIKVEQDTAWVVPDLTMGVDNDYQIVGGRTYVVPQVKYVQGYPTGHWSIYDMFFRPDGYTVDLFFNGFESDQIIKATGFICYHGEGTDDDPFLFTLAYEQPVEDVVIEVGEGHEELAESLRAFYLSRGWLSNMDGTTITLRSEQYRYGTEYKKIIGDTYALMSSYIDSPSNIDNGELLINCALNPIDSGAYSSYGDIMNEKDVLEGRRLNDDGITLYAIWADKVIDEAQLTITGPVAGDVITADDDGHGGYKRETQDPRPEVQTGSNDYSVPVKDNDPVINWEKDGSLFVGAFESGETYTAAGEIEAALGYYFASDVNMTVNGNEPASMDNDSYKIGFSADLVAKTDRYYAYAGDGGSWEKGSAKTLDFTFKRTVDDGTTFDCFKGIMIDGKEVEANETNYIATPESSVVIRLQPALLEKLATGEHTLTAVFADGMTAEAKFTVTKKSSDAVPSPSRKPYRIPETGIDG